MRIAILAHDQFPHRAKTAIGVMRYGEQEVVAILDRANAGTRVHDHTDLVPDAPIVAGMGETAHVDALVIGIAPIGGGFKESWRPDVEAALERGCDVIAGLHTFLGDDPGLAVIAERTGATIHDVRRPPDDLDVSRGIAGDVDADVYLTVGTDASIGKMTVTFELVETLRERGHAAAPVPTGQTGMMIAGWGYAIDRVIADFMAGATEELVLEGAQEHDILIVEGQGSIVHPAYSGVTCGILHGAMPDGLILCHHTGRDRIHGYEAFPVPSVERCAQIYEDLAAPVAHAPVIGGALNTAEIADDAAAEGRVEEMARTLDAPATDVIRFGVEPLLEAIE